MRRIYRRARLQLSVAKTQFLMQYVGMRMHGFEPKWALLGAVMCWWKTLKTWRMPEERMVVKPPKYG